MNNLRTHGDPPYHVAVIHGGPGAPGGMAPVAEALCDRQGVLEPLQTAMSVRGQVDELERVLREHAEPPVALIGWSWGAWLGFILAATHPALVRKLILVSSGPFEERFTASIATTRLARLEDGERREFQSALQTLSDKAARDKGAAFATLGRLTAKADAFDALPAKPNSPTELQPDIYASVWPEAAELRASGKLLLLGSRIRCPVVAIHGDHDPHPAAGVEEPLGRVLRDFRFLLLRNCGHHPWLERQAKAQFFRLLRQELA